MAEVFLSYSHLDNDTCDPADKERAWVTEFHKSLEDILKATCGREYFNGIFRDIRDREGKLEIDDFLMKALGEAKILISVLTGNYEGSEWCREEREFFLLNNLRASNYNFLIEKVPYAEKKDLIIYPFYDRDERRWETLCRHKRSEQFSQRIMDLANDIKDALKSRGEVRPKVFLSLSTPEINFKYRRSIKSELERLGFKVVPESLSINSIEDFRQKVGDSLTGVHHSFFIFGNKRSLSPEGSQKSFEELQFEMGFNNNQTPKTIWYPDFYENENMDIKQRAFIERFTKDSSPEYVNQKFDLLQCSLSKFISELENKVKETATETDRKIQLVKEKQAFILVSDEKFLVSTDHTLINKKFKDCGYKPNYPHFEGAPDEIRSHRDTCVSEANYIILWLTEDLSDNVVTSLVGDLKRATKADDGNKIIYGQINNDHGFKSFGNLDDLLAYIK